MTFTKHEQEVYNFLADTATRNDCAGFEEIASQLGISTKVARGVVASLTKKDLVVVDQGQDIVWAKHRGTGEIGFWLDYMKPDAAATSRVGAEEVK